MKKWISCEKELPDDGVIVLVTDGDTVDLGYFAYDDDFWEVEECWLDQDAITHWMPVPEADEIGEF